MSDRHQEDWIVVGFFHLLQAPFPATVAKNIVRMHHLYPVVLVWCMPK